MAEGKEQEKESRQRQGNKGREEEEEQEGGEEERVEEDDETACWQGNVIDHALAEGEEPKEGQRQRPGQKSKTER